MVYLVRHGQTDWNLLKKFNGGTDSCLNQTGIEQAKQQAENLKDIIFDICYCSPLTRARQFCEIIHKGPIIFDNRLAEIGCGEFEGAEETEDSMQMFWKAVQTGDRGTERVDVFIKRNCDLCDIIAKEHIGKHVLIVTHAANTRVINYYFMGKPKGYNFSKAVCENGGLLTFPNE